MQINREKEPSGAGAVTSQAVTRTQKPKDEPAYKRIQRAIRLRIASGDLKPGDVVDSERELAKIHGVSLMTARHALADLSQEGVVERRHGAGTFVAPPQILFNKLLSYTEQMGSVGLSTRSRIVSSAVVNREPEIAARFGLSPTSRLVRIERVRTAGDEPVAIEVCYAPDDECHALLDAPLERASLFVTLERDCSIELAYADEEIDATHADLRTSRLLNVASGAPLLRIRQLIYSTKGRAALYMTGLYRSGRHTLRIRRFR